MARKVLLPKEIDRKLDRLIELTEDEVNGVLLYRRKNDYCPIEALFMTGVGSEGHVQSQPERMEIVNEFFRRNPDYQYIKFHTHSKGTIARFGDYYARNFSQGDLDGIKEQLKDYKEFMAMLVTPETKLLCGIDNPELLVADDFPGYRNRNQAVIQALNVAAGNLGYDLSN